MRIFEKFATKHGDIIHDVAYNSYGKRLATCSADQTIKVWDRIDDGSKSCDADKDKSHDDATSTFEKGWKCRAQWKAHHGPVWKLAWASPEFGNVLVSSSFDRTAIVWEETDLRPSLVRKATGNDGKRSTSHSGDGDRPEDTDPSRYEQPWAMRAKLVDARDAVLDIQFAPPQFGMKLATASADGNVRIYEAPDPMALTHWELAEEFETGSAATCLAWCPSPFENPMLVVGCDSSPFLQVWRQEDGSRRWKMSPDSPEGNTAGIHDVSWAPSLGRNFHIVAAGSRDGTVRIWRITVKSKANIAMSGTDDNDNDDKSAKSKNDSELGAETSINIAMNFDNVKHRQHRSTSTPSASASTTTERIEITPIASFTEHKAEVWRVEWNVTGTILATTGDDGCVRVWRQNSLGAWKAAGTIGENRE